MRLLLATAIVSATVYTGEGPPLEGATVLIEGNRIAAVGQNVAVPSGARVIDAEGSVVTPGLIESASRLGLVEVSAVAASVEAVAPGEDKIRAALRVADSFNPVSVAIPVARGGGVTSTAAVPAGGLISGQSAWVDLVADDPVRRAPLALHVRIGAGGDEPGPSSRAFLRLREVFDDAKLFRGNRGPYIADRLRDLSVSAADLDVLARVLDRDLPVVFEVDRATDISTVLELVREYRLKAILLGASEGWAVADEIARAGVGALIDPLQNMPTAFDSLRSRGDNAQRLHAAGVPIAFTTGSVHQVHRLRQLAGNAVAEGLPYEVALAAITRVPAELYGVPDAGRLAVGALANVVIWNGDPLEVTTWPVRLFVRGQEIPLRSRQDELTERYLAR
jgi:imidazolonepropionase-like amidohydrolase